MAVQNALGQDTNLPGNPTTTTQAAGNNSTRVATTAYVDRISGFTAGLLNVVDQKTQNTDGGTFTFGAWRTRDLQTTRTNEISGASVASNQITLPTGSYYCEWSAPAYGGASANEHQTRLYNTTGAVVLLLGSSEAVAKQVQTRSVGSGRFTVSGSTVIELQHRIAGTVVTEGFGFASNFASEIYSQISIWKVG